VSITDDTAIVPREDVATARAEGRRGALGILADVGAAGQAVVPGVYAWAVTVAPVAWSRGAPLAAKMSAVLALVALVTTLWRAKGPLSLWVFVLSCAVTWVAAPAALSPAHLEVTRGIAGTLGWGVFAFAAAAPSLGTSREGPLPEAGLSPRQTVARGDAMYLGAGVLMAAALQAIGWTVVVPERAILVRVVTVACGIAVVGATTSAAVARHARHGASVARGARSAVAFLAFLGLLLAGAVLYVATR
jgi:hypothetical protein